MPRTSNEWKIHANTRILIKGVYGLINSLGELWVGHLTKLPPDGQSVVHSVRYLTQSFVYSHLAMYSYTLHINIAWVTRSRQRTWVNNKTTPSNLCENKYQSIASWHIKRVFQLHKATNCDHRWSFNMPHELDDCQVDEFLYIILGRKWILIMVCMIPV